MDRKRCPWSACLGAAVLLGVLGFAPSSLSAQRDEMKDEIWTLEEQYWQYVEAGDIENYVTLWHDDFVGWPCSNLHPSGVENIADWLRVIRDEGVQVSYELHLEALQHFGDVAVVHYSSPIIRRYPDGRVTGEGRLLKFTHTWMRSGGQWKIISGMCALAEPIG